MYEKHWLDYASGFYCYIRERLSTRGRYLWHVQAQNGLADEGYRDTLTEAEQAVKEAITRLMLRAAEDEQPDD